MNIEDFRFIVDTKRNFEFSFEGSFYNLTFSKEDDGKEYIFFGERYMQKKFQNWPDLMNNAKIKNSFLREIIEIL